MRRLLLLLVFSSAFLTPGGPFVKTYKSAPLAQVLQDIEAHFSLQILYRPQDIAQAPVVNGTINASDYQTALRKVLGKQYTLTVRNNIVIIKAVPPQQQKQTKPTSSKPTPSSPPPQNNPKPTNSTDKNATSDNKLPPKITSNEQPTPLQQKVAASSDSIKLQRISESQQDTFHSAKFPSEWENQEKDVEVPFPMLSPVVALQPKSVPLDSLAIHWDDFRQITLPKVPEIHQIPFQTMRHSFQAAVSIGYGSELMAQLDLRYGYYFHPNWGIGGGLNFAYALKKSAASTQEEGRIGLPIALNMRYALVHKWGMRGAVGATTSFPVYSGKSGEGISNKSIDVLPFIEMDALYPVSEHINLLFGLYAHLSAISVSPWSVGLHVGIEVGK